VRSSPWTNVILHLLEVDAVRTVTSYSAVVEAIVTSFWELLQYVPGEAEYIHGNLGPTAHIDSLLCFFFRTAAIVYH
jgi:hypothetical protein